MYRLTILAFFALLLFLSACTKEQDDRDSITGQYSGICIVTYWMDTIVGFKHDTLPGPTIFNIRKSSTDHVVVFNCAAFSQDFSFSYLDGQCTSLSNYHPPVLRIHSDSLYLLYKPGLGPYWTECYGVKK